MKIPTRRLGRTNLEITVLGFGGAPLGDFDRYVPKHQALATVEAAWAHGIRYFDTAPLYGHGLSEHRLGHVLREQPRDSFVLSTKVGRVLRPERPERIDRGPFLGGLNFAAAYDYSYDGTMRSIEQSCTRLGMDRIDIALIHDVDVRTHGSREAYEDRFGEAMEGAYRALEQLRSAGTIGAVGIGVNEAEPCVDFARAGDFDCFLLAGRYTLLEQNGLADLFPLAEQKGFSILIGGPFNSGILATGARDTAKFDYKPAPREIMSRVSRMEQICTSHGVPIAAAAIQFPLGHPRVASVVPGMVSEGEVDADVALLRVAVPPAFWNDLKSEGLIKHDAPVPAAGAGVAMENVG